MQLQKAAGQLQPLVIGRGLQIRGAGPRSIGEHSAAAVARRPAKEAAANWLSYFFRAVLVPLGIRPIFERTFRLRCSRKSR